MTEEEFCKAMSRLVGVRWSMFAEEQARDTVAKFVRHQFESVPGVSVISVGSSPTDPDQIVVELAAPLCLVFGMGLLEPNWG